MPRVRAREQVPWSKTLRQGLPPSAVPYLWSRQASAPPLDRTSGAATVPPGPLSPCGPRGWRPDRSARPGQSHALPGRRIHHDGRHRRRRRALALPCRRRQVNAQRSQDGQQTECCRQVHLAEGNSQRQPSTLAPESLCFCVSKLFSRFASFTKGRGRTLCQKKRSQH